MGWNLVGLRRRGFSHATIRALTEAYRSLFHGEGVIAERAAKLAADEDLPAEVREMAAAAASPSRRGLMTPAAG